MDIEVKLREILLPVFGLYSIEEIKTEHSLINDLGLDSLDFLEIMHLLEVNFGVVITQDDALIIGGEEESSKYFEDGFLTTEGVSLLKAKFPERESIMKYGMTKVDLFSLTTVGDLVNMIEHKMNTTESMESE